MEIQAVIPEWRTAKAVTVPQIRCRNPLYGGWVLAEGRQVKTIEGRLSITEYFPFVMGKVDER